MNIRKNKKKNKNTKSEILSEYKFEKPESSSSDDFSLVDRAIDLPKVDEESKIEEQKTLGDSAQYTEEYQQHEADIDENFFNLENREKKRSSTDPGQFISNYEP